MRKKSPGRTGRKGGKSPTRPQTKVLQPIVINQNPQPPSAYVRIFERLFRSFRMHAFEHLGDRCGEAIIRAEKKICLLAPEFDREALTDDTAPQIVDLVEEIVKGAPFFRRQKLRRGAVALVADLYNKHYQILEERSAIDRIEQAYYRLKG